MAARGTRTGEELRSTWAHRFCVAAFLSAVPLVLFGGSVTTLGAGMAVEGWLVAEGHFLLFFPIESWFRDTATFVEHTHRLFGVLVGLFAVLAVAAAFRSGAGRDRLACSAALTCVVGQGAVGGFRVLENAPELAFLHGVLAQGVFALLGVSCLVTSRAWSARPGRTSEAKEAGEAAGRLQAFALLTLLGVGVQVFLGAWYRHSLRPEETDRAGALLIAHLVMAGGVMLTVSSLAGRLRAQGETLFQEVPGLGSAPTRLVGLLGIQVFLGLLAWSGYRPGAVGPLEWTMAISHVLVGALLLTQCATTWLWLRRAAGRSSRAEAPVARWREA